MASNATNLFIMLHAFQVRFSYFLSRTIALGLPDICPTTTILRFPDPFTEPVALSSSSSLSNLALASVYTFLTSSRCLGVKSSGYTYTPELIISRLQLIQLSKYLKLLVNVSKGHQQWSYLPCLPSTQPIYLSNIPFCNRNLERTFAELMNL